MLGLSHYCPSLLSRMFCYWFDMYHFALALLVLFCSLFSNYLLSSEMINVVSSFSKTLLLNVEEKSGLNVDLNVVNDPLARNPFSKSSSSSSE